jgi:hypothetical protein
MPYGSEGIYITDIRGLGKVGFKPKTEGETVGRLRTEDPVSVIKKAE